MTVKHFYVIAYFCLVAVIAGAQKVGHRQSGKATATSIPVPETEKSKPAGPDSLHQFLKEGTIVMTGLTSSFTQDNRFYFAVSDSVLGRDILFVSRISKSAAAVRGENFGYAGDQIRQNVIRFEKRADGKILIRKVVLRERVTDPQSPMYTNFERSNVMPIIAVFDVKAVTDDANASVIDVTDFFNSDNDFLYFSSGVKKILGLGSMLSDRSALLSVRSYPINTEVSVAKTYANNDEGDPATFELNVSFVLLPEKPMVPRYVDDRIGFFNVRYTDYERNPQGVAETRLITRWRLEPKPEDLEKYRRGELVEPAKPIIYYIDPSTPKEWVPYLIQGINDWQGAFEKAGFKNAIMGKVAPTKDEDPTWSLEDARYSAVVYKPSSIPNANGPQINDPRSGEIIESHINWYHNIMSLARDWYFIQCAAVDTGAQKMIFDTKLMGELIRFVSSHEVGHALGLRHNFGGTAIYTADQIRDPKFLAENGHTTSIMDYSRFNFVAQPEDHLPRELLFPRISHYDNWAIEWGYRRFFQFDDPQKELTFLNQWVIERTKDRRLFYGREFNDSDPRNQNDDLTNNQMKANELGIKNLRIIMSHLPEWTKVENADYTNLRDMHEQVVEQYNRYLLQVTKWIGGVYEEIKLVEQPGPAYRYTEKEHQQEAMSFLNRNLINQTPTWLVPPDVLNKIAQNPLNTIEKLYTEVFFKLLNYRVIHNLTTAEMELGNHAYTANDLFTDLNANVWKSLAGSSAPDAYTRAMQKVYVRVLGNLYTTDNGIVSFGNPRSTSIGNDPTDVRSLAYYQLVTLRSKLQTAPAADLATKAHYRYLANCIDLVLDKAKKDQ